MTEELEEFERLLQKSPPPEPDERAKIQAVAKGMEAFDKKISGSRQGTSPASRLMDAVRYVHNTLLGRDSMKKAYIAAGLCLLTLVFLRIGNVEDLIPSQNKNAEKAVTHRKESVTAKSARSQNELSISPGSLPAPPSVDLSNNSLAASPPPPPPLLVTPQSPAPAPFSAPTEQSSADVKQKTEADAPRRVTEAKDDAYAPMKKAPAMEKEVFQQNNGAIAGGKAMREEMKSVSAPTSSLATAPSEPRQAPLETRAKGLVGGFGNFEAGWNSRSDSAMQATRDEGRDKFDHFTPSPVKQVQQEPVSTFSIDVDTSSYSFMRSKINSGMLPQPDAVRTEELVNYFPYEYEAPESKEEPFKAAVSIYPTPWNPNTKLMHIGIKGYEIQAKDKPHANLVFLLDTSGSMDDPVRLPLVVNAMKLLLDSLNPSDTVAIVTYAGNAGVALEPTEARNKAKIIDVLNGLSASGSTAGADGIRTAYQLAEQHFDKEGVNRVILSTDGDFNVGITDQTELKAYIAKERDKGVFLSVMGVGTGNYNDALMQTLAQNGNGVATYIDNLNEARKVLVEEATSTLFTIAKDVKIQIEFNPAQVAEYRLVGYESRILNREDFNNDKVDAGDIGSGHAVTAIYEITPVGSKSRRVDELRYQQTPPVEVKDFGNGEYAFVKIRYKLPEGTVSKLITAPVDSRNESKTLAEAPQEARFATAVAAYGQLLKGDTSLGSFSYDDVIALARAARGPDTFGYRSEFINLVELAKHMAGVAPTKRINE